MVFYLKLRYFIDGSLTSCCSTYQVTVNPHISWHVKSLEHDKHPHLQATYPAPRALSFIAISTSPSESKLSITRFSGKYKKQGPHGGGLDWFVHVRKYIRLHWPSALRLEMYCKTFSLHSGLLFIPPLLSVAFSLGFAQLNGAVCCKSLLRLLMQYVFRPLEPPLLTTTLFQTLSRLFFFMHFQG